MSEKTFTIVGTAVNADGTIKVRWANDLASRVKLLSKAGCTDINLVELEEPMTKLDALQYFSDNYELTDVQSEIVSMKLDEKTKAAKRAEVKETLTKNVKTEAKGKKSDPKVEKFVEQAQAEAAEAE